MSAFIEILDKGDGSEFNVAIRAKTVTFWTYGTDDEVIGFDFNMTNESDRQALKTLVECLQQQLDIHGG